MAATARNLLHAQLVLALGGADASSNGIGCLLWQGEGCESITTESECLRRRDGRPWARKDGLLVSGQPCSWCGGEMCANSSDALCLPHDWVQQRANISTANCSNNETRKAQVEAAPASANDSGGSTRLLFEKPARGARCSATNLEASEHINKYYFTYSAATADECRAICAAQDYCTGFGFEAANQTCKAWWHPIESTTPTSEARDQCAKAVVESSTQRHEGEDQIVMALTEDDPQGNATSQELEAHDGLTDQEDGVHGDVAGSEGAECLLWQGQGCESITDEAECLNRRDGRPWVQRRGLLIAEQPCSWCGGEKCDDGSDAMCLPNDWVKQRAKISTANCSKNETRKVRATEVEASASAGGGGGSSSLRFEKPVRGARCTAALLNASVYADKYYFTYSAATADECRTICAAQGNCTGFGFEAASQICRSWWHPIESTVPSLDVGDQCSKAIIVETAEEQSASDEREVTAQMDDNPQGNATGEELAAQDGLTDQQKGAIAGGVVGGVAAAGLLGGLLGGLLPHGTTTVTTTLMDQILRIMADNETMDDFANDSANNSLVFTGGALTSQACASSWIRWVLAAALVLALVALVVYCLLSSGLSGSSRGIEDFESDEESMSATPRLEDAQQHPVLLARTPLGADYKPVGMGSMGVEIVATQPTPIHSLGMEPVHVHSMGTGAPVRGLGASASVRSLERQVGMEPVTAWGHGANALAQRGMPVSMQCRVGEPGRDMQIEPLGNIR